MISVAVMAHPSRHQWVSQLVDRLDATPQVVWDEVNDRWDTGRRSLLAYHPDADWHLVIQDDAIIHDNLVAACHAIVGQVPPGVPVSLYMGRWRHRPRTFPMNTVTTAAQANGAAFARFGGPWWGPALLLPAAHVPAIVEYGDENPRKHKNYDIRIAQFYDTEGVDCWYTMPSIVDHREGPSLTGRKGKRRHAEWFHEGAYDELDWSGGVVTPADMTFKGRFPVTP